MEQMIVRMNYDCLPRPFEMQSTGFDISYGNTKIAFSGVDFSITVDENGKVEISNGVGKKQFLDLMSKLYDMAEVK